MRRIALLPVLLTITAGAAFAGNARTDRTATTFQRDQARQAALNRQWSQHFARLRMDQNTARRGRAVNPDGSLSRTYALQKAHRQSFNAWRNTTRPRYTPMNYAPSAPLPPVRTRRY